MLTERPICGLFDFPVERQRIAWRPGPFVRDPELLSWQRSSVSRSPRIHWARVTANSSSVEKELHEIPVLPARLAKQPRAFLALFSVSDDLAHLPGDLRQPMGQFEDRNLAV